MGFLEKKNMKLSKFAKSCKFAVECVSIKIIIII